MSHQKRAKIPGITPELTVVEVIDGRTEFNLITDKEYCRTSHIAEISVWNKTACAKHRFKNQKIVKNI